MSQKVENLKVEDVEGKNVMKRTTMVEQSSMSYGNCNPFASNNSIILKSKLKDTINEEEEEEEEGLLLSEWRSLEANNVSGRTIDLGNGSEVIYYPTFLDYQQAWRCFDYLNTNIPWTRPTIRVFGRSFIQPRDTCYVANEGLPKLVYSGYQPHSYSWHQFPPLQLLLQAVEDAIPGSHFNSLLLNRYKGGNDYVGWHSDDESLYGSTPLIASISFGCDRDFFLKKKKTTTKNPQKTSLTRVTEKNARDEPARKRLKKSNDGEQHSFTLKHGSLLVMRGYTQRDWIHSVPKRAKASTARINLTFRLVL